MDDSTETESIDMSVEELSPSGSKSSISFGPADENPSTTTIRDSFSAGTCLNSFRDRSPASEHSSSRHGSVEIGEDVDKTLSSSASYQHQHALVFRGHSGSAGHHDYASSQTRSAEESTEDRQDIHPSRLHMLRENCSVPQVIRVNTASISSFESLALTKRALTPDPVMCKRRKISFSCSDTIENDPKVSVLTDANRSPSTYPQSVSIVSDGYVEDFLDNLSSQIHKSVLENLCPDNMRGSFCRTPDVCFSQGCFFACPNYATLKHCKHEEHSTFAHPGYKHTFKGCQVNEKVKCKKIHTDGNPCRVKVIHFHVRAACITLRGGTYCQKEPCEWGHDHMDIRKRVMSSRISIYLDKNM